MAKDLNARIKDLEEEIKDPQSTLHVEGLLVSCVPTSEGYRSTPEKEFIAIWLQ